MKKNLPQKAIIKLDQLFKNVGDMSLKRRALKVILGLELKEGDNIVDLGCGDGFYLYLLSSLPMKFKLTGLDYDEIVLKNTKENLLPQNIKLIKCDVTKIPFKKNIFKKIIMTEVLEHVENDKEALSEAYRILKPNGILVLTVPSYNFPFMWDPINWVLQNLFKTHISGNGFFAGIWARHLRLYKRKNLEKLISKTGFKIEEVEELTTRALPFNHHLVNLVARFLYSYGLPSDIADSLSKFKNADKPILIKIAFFLVNIYDKLNDIFPGKNGLNIYVQARK